MSDLTEIVLAKEWLVDALPYEIFWADENGGIIYGNKILCERLQYSQQELTKLTIFDINTTVTLQSWKIHWENVKKNKIENFKAIHRNKSGKFYEVEVFAQFFSNGRKEMICGIMNDISSSSFYKNLIDNVETIAKVGGWKLNLQDGSILVTKEALSIFNKENNEDFHPSKIVHFFKDEELFRNNIVKTIKNAIPIDHIFETKETPSRYIRTIVKPVLKGDKIFKIVGVYQDITEQTKKEIRLKFFKDIIDNAQDLIFIYNICKASR